MNQLLLEYTLKAKGVSRETLARTQGWSAATTTRRLNGRTPWTVNEVRNLLRLGFTLEDVEKIFFSDSVS